MSLNVLVATPFGSNPDSAGTASGDAREHSADGPEAWSAHIEIARQSGQPADLQVLADEAPSADLRAAARIGEALDGLGAGPNDLAIAQGLDRLRVVCPWNGDGAGGAADMAREVTRRTGQVTWLDTRELW